jgi:hypothetical protein
MSLGISPSAIARAFDVSFLTILVLIYIFAVRGDCGEAQGLGRP